METTDINIKRAYSTPIIEIISLDNEISLVLSSRVIPGNPENDLFYIEEEYFINTPVE